MNCPDCCSERVVKNGKSRHGHQRYMCRACGLTFGETDHRRVDPATREMALRQYAEGIGARTTERLLGVSHNSVLGWVRKEVSAQALAPVPAQELQVVEIDEMWSYVGSKKSRSGCGGQ